MKQLGGQAAVTISSFKFMLHNKVRKQLVQRAITFLADQVPPTLVRINQFDDGTILVRTEWTEPKAPRYAKVTNGVWLNFDGPADALAHTTWTYSASGDLLDTLARTNKETPSVEAGDQL